MMPYHAYQVLEAERPKTAAERRAADIQLGETAAAIAQLAGPVRALRRLFQRAHRGAGSPAPPASASPISHRTGGGRASQGPSQRSRQAATVVTEGERQ